jgi:hypothetical protein
MAAVTLPQRVPLKRSLAGFVIGCVDYSRIRNLWATWGWGQYFSYGYPRRMFNRADSYVLKRVVRHLQRRSQRPFRPPEGRSFLAHLQSLGLQLLEPTLGQRRAHPSTGCPDSRPLHALGRFLKAGCGKPPVRLKRRLRPLPTSIPPARLTVAAGYHCWLVSSAGGPVPGLARAIGTTASTVSKPINAGSPVSIGTHGSALLLCSAPLPLCPTIKPPQPPRSVDDGLPTALSQHATREYGRRLKRHPHTTILASSSENRELSINRRE